MSDKEKIDRLEQELADAEQEIKDLQSELEYIETLESQVDDLWADIDNLKDELIDAEFELDKVNKLVRENHLGEIEVLIDYRWYSMDELVSRMKEGVNAKLS